MDHKIMQTATTTPSQHKDSKQSWADLPTDILNDILRIANQQMDRGFFNTERNQLSECQHVCKAWSRVAQAILYKKVELNARNISSFLSTITSVSLLSSSPTSLLVNHVHFDQTFSRVDFLNYIEPIKVLFTSCTNLRHITCSKETQQLILPCLSFANSSKLSQLKSICCPSVSSAHEDSNMPLTSLFPFKDTLEMMYIKKLFTWSTAQQILYKNLMAYLSDYTALKKLVVQVTESISLAEFDTILNSCKQLEEISISSLSFINENNVDILTQNMVYHKNLKTLHIADLSLNDVHVLEYLTKKCIHLKTFSTQLPVSHTHYLLTEWETLIHSIKHVRHYEVTTKSWNFEDILDSYISHIYNKSSSGCQDRKKKKVIVVHFNSLNYDPNTPTVIYAFNQFIRSESTEMIRFRIGGHSAIQKYLEVITHTIQQACPHEVVITGLNYFGPHYKRLKESDLHHFRVKDHHPFFFNTVDTIFKACQHIPGLQLTLGDLILRDAPSPLLKFEDVPRIQHLKKLTIDNSTIHRLAFHPLSQRLAEIDVLKLNMCDLTGQQPRRQEQEQQQQQLQKQHFQNFLSPVKNSHQHANDPKPAKADNTLYIEMPFTKINTLVLILPTNYPRDYLYTYPELSQALSSKGSSSGGMYILKIESEEDGIYYTCMKNFSEKVEKNDLLPLLCNQLLDVNRVALPFVISIKCKSLQHLTTSNGDAETFDWDKADI